MRAEVHPKGVEVVTVCLEIDGAEAARPLIEAAHPEHPSLIDTGHEVDAKFGVVNVPNGVWIDEQGMIVRPAEPAWSGGQLNLDGLRLEAGEDGLASMQGLAQGTSSFLGDLDTTTYAQAVRDWADNGAASRWVLGADEVVARSQPRPLEVSEAAAHFELGQHLWQSGDRDGAIAHFNHAHRLQPDNWTYKRQAWSLVSREATPGPIGRFIQSPVPGTEDTWPFDSNFFADVQKLGPGEYYPTTM